VLRRVTLIVALLLLLAAAILFTALNQQRFEVDVAFAKFVVSSGLALVIAFAAGLVTGALWRSTWIARLLSERGRLRHALRLAESRQSGTPSSPDAG
jgi:uncharacterized membrane protein YciS (DUF1049 family)